MSHELIATLPSHFGVVQKVVFSADSRQLFSCAENGLVRTWELTAEGRPATGFSRGDFQGADSTRTFVGHAGRVQSLAVAPDGRKLASVGFDGTVRLWDLTARGDSVPMLKCKVHPQDQLHRYRMHLTPDLARFTVVTDDFQSVEYDVLSGREINRRPIKPVNGHGFGFTPGHVPIAWRHADSALLIAQPKIDGPLEFSQVLSGEAQHGEFSADGRRIATAGHDGFVRVQDVTSGSQVYASRVADPVVVYNEIQSLRLQLSNPGRWLALANIKGGLIDLDTGDFLELSALKTGVRGVTFSPDDTMLAVVFDNGSVQLIDVENRRLLQSLRALGPIEIVAFSTDNKTLAVATTDGQVVLYHAITGQELVSLLRHQGTNVHLQFSRDDSALAAEVVDRTTSEVHLYVWSTQDRDAADVRSAIPR